MTHSPATEPSGSAVPAELLIPEHDLNLLLSHRHWSPHDHYGWHQTARGSVVRTRQVGAEKVDLLIDGSALPMLPVGNDIWVVGLDSRRSLDYRFSVTWPGSTPVVAADGYHFLPTVGELDLYLIGEGRHERLWDVLGANLRSFDTPMGHVDGTAFAVWAPNAEAVAVVGDFCGWNAAQFPMRSLGSSGIWEIFIPGVGAGATYKFAIQTRDGRRLDKADPLAKQAETPPATASVVAESSHTWRDSQWIARREATDPATQPMSVYEVHLGSWRQGLGYEGLAHELVDYVAEHGYTHVEFLPVAEHPFGGSWGYQVTGYYAPTSRWGSPDQFRQLIDAFHARGIGVIMDWVPGHFPKDEWALARFDGPALYEHPDWRRGEQRDWGTYVFDFGRAEVRNFLVANALYWFEEFHIDGIRVDAVASMLYLDYSRNEGEWVPNQYGGRENLEAVQFLQEMNATVHKTVPGVLTIAEESTSWPGVTAPTYDNGLGFSLKWNMGWMNDTLQYFKEDPVNRKYHHNEITFSMVYAYSERYVLPFSHDEVVHGKGSLWGRMPGNAWLKAANLRTLYGYMYSHPGKNLLFQGQEFGQVAEWNESQSLHWGDCDGWEGEFHRGLHDLTAEINRVYRGQPALYTQDNGPEGFQWLKSDDAGNNMLAYVRYGSDGSALLAIVNMSGSRIDAYRLGLPQAGVWKLVLNTDDSRWQGASEDLPAEVQTENQGWDGFSQSALFRLPALSVQWYQLQP